MISDRIDFSDLIPEYHHRMLDAEMVVRFEEELERNDKLREELAEFESFEKLYQSIDDMPEPSEDVFAKVMNRIEEDEGAKEGERVKESKPHPLIEKLGEAVTWIKDSVTLPWGLAVVQAMLLVILLVPEKQEEALTTLSSTSGVTLQANVVSCNIVFQPAATEAEIRILLLSVKGRIISGPSTQGRYVISIPKEGGVDDTIAKLQRDTSVVFVEKTN